VISNAKASNSHNAPKNVIAVALVAIPACCAVHQSE